MILVSDIERQLQTLEELKNTLSQEQHQALDNMADELRQKLENQNVNIKVNNSISRLEKWLSIEEENWSSFQYIVRPS